MRDSRQVRRQEWAIAAAIGVALAGAAAVLFTFDPVASKLYPPCPLHAATGLYCPGCGSRRAILRLLHGDLGGACSRHPLMIASLPFLAFLGLRRSWALRPWLPWVALVILLSYAVLRNIPTWPFVLLAPR